ncbi:MAG TPA: HAMP domain-containing sensor histidine kinase [Longimicrobiales bacterium]
MVPHRDDVEALSSVTGLLLEPGEPSELAERFLAHVARLFPSDAALFYVPAEDSRPVHALGMSASEAARLAAELVEALGVAEPVRHAVEVAGWPQVLAAAASDGGEVRGLVALFSSRPGAYDIERDGRILRHMSRHGAAAVVRARRDRRLVERAERRAVRAEQLERIRSALERHSREVERTMAARGRFFAQMSHELRTPVNAIVGYVDLMQQGVVGRLTARQADVVGRVAASAQQLLGLVNDILDLSKLESGRLTVEHREVDLRMLVRETAGVVELEAARKGLELRVSCPDAAPVLRTDPGRLRQILLNLLSNAVKFTDAGSVSVSVGHLHAAAEPPAAAPPTCRAGSDGWIVLTVEDTGPGIPAEELETIFGEYVQLAVGPRGTGLGLAISRRLAQLLGGELLADSVVGARSTFLLYLPCPAPITEDAAETAADVLGRGAVDART